MNNFSDPVAASRYPLRENNRPYVCSPPDSRGMKQWRNAISRAKCIPVKFSTCSSLLLFQKSRIFLSAILFLKSSIHDVSIDRSKKFDTNLITIIIKKKRVFLIISLQYFCYVNRGGLFFRESIVLEIVSVVLRHWIRFVWREGGNEDQA